MFHPQAAAHEASERQLEAFYLRQDCDEAERVREKERARLLHEKAREIARQARRVEAQAQMLAGRAERERARMEAWKRKFTPLAAIVDTCAAYYGVTAEDICSADRHRRFVRPRQVACYLMRPASYPSIGRALGGRDHTTIIHAQRRVAALLESSPALAHEVADIRERLQ